MAFHNLLVSVNEVRSEYQDIDATTDDALFLKLVRDVSGQIAQYADRHFVPRIQTRYFDGRADVDGLTLTLDSDLLAATTITNGDTTTVSATSYVTEPRNETPYQVLRLKASAGLTWTYQDDPENAISIAGVWGYHDEYADAWVSTTTTAATCDASGTSLTVGASTLFAGQLCKLDDEFVLVTTDSSTAGVTVVERGANGSTAAVHEAGVAVSVWTPIYVIRELAREGVAALYRLRGNPLADTFVALDGTTFTTPKDVSKFLERRVKELGLRRN